MHFAALGSKHRRDGVEAERVGHQRVERISRDSDDTPAADLVRRCGNGARFRVRARDLDQLCFHSACSLVGAVAIADCDCNAGRALRPCRRPHLLRYDDPEGMRLLSNRLASKAPLLLTGLLACLSLSALEPVGFAVSEQPFLVEGAEVWGNATVLAGETVSSNRVPLRVRLTVGHEIVLGPGSQAAFWADRVHVDGVSAEIRAAPGEAFKTELGRLLVDVSAGGSALVYSDRADLASVVARGAPLQVSAEGLEPFALSDGEAASFSVAAGEVRVQTNRAPLEIARIQIRQLSYLNQMAVTRPGVERRSRPLLQLLSDASGGLLQIGPAQEQIGRDMAPAVDADRLLRAAIEVHEALLTEPWADAGCGSPDCVRRRPVHRPNDFVGWADSIPPQAGCELCRLRALDALE